MSKQSPSSSCPVASGARLKKASFVPADDLCFAWWDRFRMLDNIRRHSRMVAELAAALAADLKSGGLGVDVAEVRAAGLLHDLAKTYTIAHGGNHSQLGSAWLMELTGNPTIAQAVAHHVMWPWEIDLARHSTALLLIYADKRVRHDEYVSLDDRFEDLLVRYGTTETVKSRIRESHRQALDIENLLSLHLLRGADAYPLAGGRLVERT